MKTLALFFFLVASTLASSCHPNYECCQSNNVIYTDSEGNWGVENGNWCLMPSNTCEFEKLGYTCCSHCNIVYTDSDGNWGIENNNWCGIPNRNCGSTPTTTTTTRKTTTTTTTTTKKTYASVPTTYFTNNIYSNSQYQGEVQSSINRLSGNLQSKANRVKYVPTAVWLAWDGAPGEVAKHLGAAGSNTAVFLLYWIPNRDCNSNASKGGANDLNSYKSYVDSVYNTFSQNSNKKIVIVIEPDTIGNMVTSQDNATCRNTAVLHKEALAYAVNKFGSLNHVHVYLDAAHSKWLNHDDLPDKTAAIIKEILDKAPNAKIRGFSSNVSNYRPVDEEYDYYVKLYDALEKVGITGMRFIMDTSRNGQLVNSPYETYGTWCNLIGTGFGERPKGNPDPINMPLLDAYMWLKPPGEADGSSVGSKADPVCSNPDSLQTSPDAGSWYHEYFVQLLTNANPSF